MSTEQDKMKEDREFQIELLKIQIKNEIISTQLATTLSIGVSAFVSLAVVYLSYGLTSGNHYYTLVAVIAVVILYIYNRLAGRYFESKKLEELLKKDLEKEFQPIRNKFIKTSETTKAQKP